MKTDKKTATVRELAQKFDISRDAVQKVLEGVPFEVGANRAHLFNRKEAERLLGAATRATAELKELRLEKLRHETELARKKAEEFAKEHVALVDHINALDWQRKVFYRALDETKFLFYPQRIQVAMEVERQAIAEMRRMELPEKEIKPRQDALNASEKQFKQDLASGRIPLDWQETVRPENPTRVWSKVLGRYIYGHEILKAFGPGTIIVNEPYYEIHPSRNSDGEQVS